MKTFTSDVLIIGSGVAALQTALYASKTRKVTILTKTAARSSNTYLAQGGIAAAHAPYDSAAGHVKDTMEAGSRHNERDMVQFLAENGAAAIDELIGKGMFFDRDGHGRLLYGLEGAHSERRILHSGGDATGRQLVEHLLERIREADIEIRENETAIELLLSVTGECIGVLAKNGEGSLRAYFSPFTVIATGGCGQLYPYSTNGKNATGDGYALALKAGAKLRDMEFIQFHPTGLYVNGVIKGLISEATRGEGGRLVDERGTPVMEGVHPLRDLAPRHVVAAEVDRHLSVGSTIYLDIKLIKDFESRFPTISTLCKANGISLADGRIPVAPASHFMMGGIEVDRKGRTSVPGLFAVGEAACTGVHGANRLASNSLLEGIIFGKELGLFLGVLPLPKGRPKNIRMLNSLKAIQLPGQDELRARLWKAAGIVREEGGLAGLADWLEQWNPADLLTMSFKDLSVSETQTVFMLLVAGSIAHSALWRKESRGGHIRSDYSCEAESWERASIMIDKENRKGYLAYEQIEAKGNAAGIFY